MPGLPFVSIIVPCRNETHFIAACLDSIRANDYPADRIEILVVDGQSDDGTAAILKEWSAKDPRIRVLDNPKRATPVALNIGADHACGDIIMRLDAHATYDSRYVSNCVRALETQGADNVGGIWRIRPRSDTLLAWSVVQALSHRFGTGNAHYRLAPKSTAMVVDTVPFFCLRRATLDKVGRFNDALSRGQDMEFSLRLKRSGFVTLLLPDVVTYYYARTELGHFIRHNFTNGVWAIVPFVHTEAPPVSPRHLMPLAFVSWLLLSGVVSFMTPVGIYMFAAGLGPYVLGDVAASLDVAMRERRAAYLLTMPVLFPALHISYGLGSVAGLFRVLGIVFRGGARRHAVKAA